MQRTSPASNTGRYGITAILLHWVLGLVLIGLFGLGAYMSDLPFSPQRLKLYNWHKWTGVAALYLLFFAVPLAGWAYSSAAGFPVVFLGLVPLPDFVPVSKALADVLKPIHATLAFALAGLVLVHVAAALKHQWIDNDGLLQRMLPGRR